MYANSSFTTCVVCAVVFVITVVSFLFFAFDFDGFTCRVLASAGVRGGDSMLVLPPRECDSGTGCEGSLCGFVFGVRKLFRLLLVIVL